MRIPARKSARFISLPCIGGVDDPCVRSYRRCASYLTVLLVLKKPRQSNLRSGSHRLDLVQKQRACATLGDDARARLPRAGECVAVFADRSAVGESINGLAGRLRNDRRDKEGTSMCVDRQSQIRAAIFS